MNKQSKTMRLTLMGLFAAVLLLMAYTPLGYLNIGPLAITFNVIPVALAAITLGPVGGVAMGAVFGLTSFCNASAWEAPAPWEQCFWHQPCVGLHPAFHPQTSGRISAGICLPLQPQSRRRQNRLHDHRILQRISQHRIFHVPFSTAVRQYFLCAGTDGW